MELIELQESKRSKTDEFETLIALAQDEKRELTEDEVTKVDGLKEEVRNLDEQIETAEKAETVEREAKEAAEKLEAEQEAERQAKEVSDKEAADEAERQAKELADKEADEALVVERAAKEQEIADLKQKLTTEREAKEALEVLETERNLQIEKDKTMEKNPLMEALRGQLEQGAQAQTITVERAAVDGDTSVMGDVIPKGVSKLDILGKDPIYLQMGVDHLTGVKGTYTLPFQDPIIGAKLAELAGATGDVVTPNGVLISPNRYTVTKAFTVETLASATDDFFNKVLSDMVKGCDRAITKDVYVKALAGATEVAAGDVTKDGFDALMAGAEIEYGGAFLSNRATFFEAKGVKIDSGSGRFLVETVAGNALGKGTVYDGTDYWYSLLFEDGANQQYVVYGDVSRIHVADYGMLEIIVDKFTLATTGKIVITINKIADVALLNPAAFTKSADLNPVT